MGNSNREYYISNEYLLEQSYVFESNMKIIAKHFLKDYFNIEGIFKMEFGEILTKFNKLDPINNLEFNGEEEFYKEICKEYIGIIDEPRGNYFKHINEAMDNLCEIEDNLKYCNLQIKKSVKENRNDVYYIKRMQYFIEINQEQKDAIVKFLMYEIKSQSLKDSRHNGSLIMSLMDYPYTYSMISKIYDPKMPHNVEVKFGDLSIKESRKIINLYQDNIDEYYNYIQNYIIDNEIPSEIIKRIKGQYYLKERIAILEPAIKSYIKGDRLIFINLATIQIEGLFHEYCRVIDVEVESKKYTLVQKIENIKSKKFFYGYEYFSFDFPKLRNKVAHGRLIESNDIINISNELILDLYYLVGIFDDIYLPVNTLVHTFNNFTDENPNKDEIIDYLIDGTENLILFDYLFEDSYYEMMEFYSLIEKRKAIKAYLIKDDIWNKLIRMIDEYNVFGYNNQFNKRMETIKERFMKSEPHKQQSIRLNKKLSEIKKEKT